MYISQPSQLLRIEPVIIMSVDTVKDDTDKRVREDDVCASRSIAISRTMFIVSTIIEAKIMGITITQVESFFCNYAYV